MRFLHINTTDSGGGAARCTYALHRTLLDMGHQSHILCGIRRRSASESSAIIPGRYGWIINCTLGRALQEIGLGCRVHPATPFLRRSQWVRKWADVVILGNLHGWYFPITQLPAIVGKARIIWRLHDMWPCTGNCAYSYDCERWRSGCGLCPRRHSYPSMLIDRSRQLWQLKKSVFSQLGSAIQLAPPSRWLSRIANYSPLTAHFPMHVFPYGIDTAAFMPRDPTVARKKLGIHEKALTVMFSYASKGDSWRKGQDLLPAFLEQLVARVGGRITLLLAGCDVSEHIAGIPEVTPVKVGFLAGDEELARCYNAADIYVCLSRADNLPTALLEASACGTPSVTLSSGGCGEAIEHGRTGLVAGSEGEAADMAASLLHDNGLRNRYGRAARHHAEMNFASRIQAEAVIRLATRTTATCADC